MRIILFVLLIHNFLFSRSISFDEAYTLTMKNSLELKAKKLDIKLSKKNLDEIKGFTYGSLFLSSSLSKTNHAANIFAMKLSSREASFKDFGFSQINQGINTIPSDLNNPKSINNFENKIVYNLNLFSGFKLESAKNMAQLDIMAQNAKYTYNEKNLSLEILKAYNGAVSSKYYLQAALSAEKTSNTFVYYAEEFYQEGLARKIDLKQAKVHLLEVKTKIIQAKNSYKLSLAYLKFLTNDTNITEVKEFKDFNISNYKLKKYQDLALRQRNDYLSIKYNLKILKENISLSKSILYPQINTHLEYGLNTKKLNHLDSEHDFYLISLNIKYSLFDLNKTNIIEKNKIKYQQAKIYSDYYQKKILLDVEKKFLNLESFKNIYHEKIKTNDLAEDIMHLSKQMYLNKLISMNELLLSESKTYESKANLIKAKFNLTQNYANLLFSYGQLLKDK